MIDSVIISQDKHDFKLKLKTVCMKVITFTYLGCKMN